MQSGIRCRKLSVLVQHSSSTNSKAMASVSFLPSYSLCLLQGFRRNKNSNILCCKKNELLKKICYSVSLRGEEHVTKRRELLIQLVSAPFIFPAIAPVALAAQTEVAEDFRLYTDEVNKYRIEIPQDWQVGTGKGDGVRSLIAFYPEEASNSNVSILITGLGADFTKLESFGKVDAFAESLVGGLDRSWLRPPGVAAKLIDSKAANGLYYIEYTLKNPGESRRHLLSVLGMANNGFYNRLYTITGQFVDEEEDKYGSKIRKAVSSFRLT